MNIVDLHVTGNGFFLFDPIVLRNRYGGIPDGTNLLDRYIQTDEGEDVVKAGAMLPVFNIPVSDYRIVLCGEHESSREEDHVWKTNERYPLVSQGRLCLSDMGILLHWDNKQVDGLAPLIQEHTFLSFKVGLFVERDYQEKVLSYGYILKYRKETSLSKLTADLEESMVL